MSHRKSIQRRRRLEREARRRAESRTEIRRRFIRIGAGILVLVGAVISAIVFNPFAGSGGEAEARLPAILLTAGDNYFRPDTLTLQAGQPYRLTVVNEGQSTHDIWLAGSDGKTSTGDDVRSKPLPGGGRTSVKIKYDNPGKYYFVCTFHGGQGGTLIVQ